jgi:hypothetical protein
MPHATGVMQTRAISTFCHAHDVQGRDLLVLQLAAGTKHDSVRRADRA